MLNLLEVVDLLLVEPYIKVEVMYFNGYNKFCRQKVAERETCLIL